jgi:hypothetical protein
MTKNKIVLLTLFLLIAGIIYFYLYKDSFGSHGIQIMHRSIPARANVRPKRNSDAGVGVMFGFNKRFELTEVKVIPVSDIQTNKYPHPIWHLVSDSNSIPVKGFAYGEKIPGMKPSVEGVRPDSLEPNVLYRLIVEAGSVRGEHDFQVQGQAAR